MALWLLIIGLVSMLGQVVLLRELSVAFYGSELIYVLALGLWLLGSASGAALGGRAAQLRVGHVRAALFVLGWMLPAAVVWTRASRRLVGSVPGAYLPFTQQLLVMAISLLPAAAALGLLFSWAARQYVDERRSLARAYAIESAGGILGGVLATLWLRWGVTNFAASLLGMALGLAAAGLPGSVPRSRALVVAIATSAVVLALASVRSAEIDRALTAKNHPALVDTRDSPYGRITVTTAEGQLSVFENDAVAFESESTAAEELAHLAAIQHPRPMDVLVLGAGVEGVVREVLRHHPSRVDYVELDAVLLELLRPHLPEAIRRSLSDPATRVTIADPRRFLGHAGRYDLILVGMPEPDSGQTNRFYTREFFRRCAEHLAPGGVLAFRLRGAENLWTRPQTRRAASIDRALREVYADAVVLPGVTNVFLASDAPLSRDGAALATRLRERGIEARLVIPAYVDYLYANDRFREIADVLRDAVVPANTDARPVCYRYTWQRWLSRFFPGAARLELPDLRPRRLVASTATWGAVAVALALLIVLRGRVSLRGMLLAFFAGFAGMVLETVLLLGYQTSCGVLFQDLGLLLMSFMAGLAAGAAGMDARARRAGGSSRRTGAVVIALLVALCGIVAGPIFVAATGSLPAAGAILFVTGALVAALFAHASWDRPENPRSRVAPLYASDLLGGCAGSLAASLLLVPAAGLAGSAALTAGAVLLALALV